MSATTTKTRLLQRARIQLQKLPTLKGKTIQQHSDCLTIEGEFSKKAVNAMFSNRSDWTWHADEYCFTYRPQGSTDLPLTVQLFGAEPGSGNTYRTFALEVFAF